MKHHWVGAFTYADMARYEGDWLMDGREGQGLRFGKPMIPVGTYTYPNGDRYEGEWKGDKRAGQGTQ